MDNVAFIVGESYEITQNIAECLKKNGWQVCIGITEPSNCFLETSNVFLVDLLSEDSFVMAAESVEMKYGKLDLLINCINPFLPEDFHKENNYEVANELFNIKALGQIRACNAFYPLLKAGRLKRICWITAANSSMNRYCDKETASSMSMRALNAAIAIIFNRLKEEMFTFRLFATTQTDFSNPIKLSKILVARCLSDRFEDEHDQARKAELRLFMQDIKGQEIPW